MAQRRAVEHLDVAPLEDDDPLRPPVTSTAPSSVWTLRVPTADGDGATGRPARGRDAAGSAEAPETATRPGDPPDPELHAAAAGERRQQARELGEMAAGSHEAASMRGWMAGSAATATGTWGRRRPGRRRWPRRRGCRLRRLAQTVPGEDLLRQSGCHDRARPHEDDPVAEGHRLVEVVEDHADGQALVAVEAPDEGQDVDLVAHVEVRRRLVEEEDPGPLGQGHRHPGSLALAAGERVDRTIRERLEPGRDERPLDRITILRGRRAAATDGGSGRSRRAREPSAPRAPARPGAGEPGGGRPRGWSG